MTGRRSIVGLALFSALLFSAFAAQSAMAAFVNNTNVTAFECKSGGALDYSDAHCDHAVSPGTGSFGHTAIGPVAGTEIEITNAGTKNNTTETEPADLHGVLAGAEATITATTVTGTGTISNVAGTGTEMKVEGTATINYTGVTVDQPEHCTAVEPITVNAKFHGVKEGTKMGLQFEPLVAGGNFASITFGGGASCPLNGSTINVKGTAIGTAGGNTTNETEARPEANGSGATTVFEAGNGMEALTIGGNTATFTSKTTTKMKNGNPIALTTT